MECPFYEREYIGVCIAYGLPYMPSTKERENYCFKEDFGLCPIYKKAVGLKGHNDR